MRFLFAALLALTALPANAQQTRSMAAGASSPPATLADVAWLVGTWAGEQGDGRFASETYSEPKGGQITGHFFETREDRVSLMELMQIVESNGSLIYRLRHFRPDFSGWEDKDGTPTEFRLIAVEDGRFYFDGITLDASEPGKLDFWVRVSSKDGAAREIVYRYDRVPVPVAPPASTP